MSEFTEQQNTLVQLCLSSLLEDKTTGKNIVFATDSYADQGEEFAPEREITEDLLPSLDLKPRILKSKEEQAQRTRKNAEVFTPAWLCCKMNNHCDEEWFGKQDVFNVLNGEQWTVTTEPVDFPEGKTWQEYIDSRRLEITCGEAPYIVSRYDAATGEPITLKDRIGILDRKLRIVNENTTEYEGWEKWTLRAFQSVYGYEWQGDSLLIARINLLMTLQEYFTDRWGDDDVKQLKALARKVANIVAWNFWQMDGLTGIVPFGEPEKEYHHVLRSGFPVSWVFTVCYLILIFTVAVTPLEAVTVILTVPAFRAVTFPFSSTVAIEFQESVPECHTFLISLLDMDFIPAADDHIPHQPCISDCLAFSLDFPFFLQYNTSDREVVFPWSTESKLLMN